MSALLEKTDVRDTHPPSKRLLEHYSCGQTPRLPVYVALRTIPIAKLAPGREAPVQAAMQPPENRWTKKRKAEEEAAIVPPANVVMQFQSDDGVKAGALPVQYKAAKRVAKGVAILLTSGVIASIFCSLQGHS